MAARLIRGVMVSRQLIIMASAAFVFTSCAASIHASSEAEIAKRNVGNHRWTSRPSVKLCSTTDMYALSSCTYLREGTGFTTLDISSGGYAGMLVYYLIRTDNQQEGYITDSAYKFETQDEDSHAIQVAKKKAERDECDRRGGVRVGMTEAQVRASCWGKPQKINVTITGRARDEQWVYPGYNYLYFSDGVLRSIQTSN